MADADIANLSGEPAAAPSSTDRPAVAPFPLDHASQIEALLKVTETIAQQRDLQALFHDLAERLHAVLQYDFLALVLHNPSRNTMRLHILEVRDEPEHHKDDDDESPVEGTPSGWVWQTQQPFVANDIPNETRYPDFMVKLKEENIHTIAILPLTTAQHRLGAIAFGRYEPTALCDAEIEFMQRVSAQVAVAVDNAFNYEKAKAYRQQLTSERDRLKVLLEINNLLVSTRDITTLFKGIVSSLKPVVHHDYTSLALVDETSGNLLKIHALDLPAPQNAPQTEFSIPRDQSPAGQAILRGEVLIARDAELDRLQPNIAKFFHDQGVHVVCCVPLTSNARTFGTINFASRDPQAFTTTDVELLKQVAAQVAIALENALAFRQIDALKDKLAVEKLYLEEEIRSESDFDEVIGESPAWRRALAQVELAAPAGTTVLIQGETGTGKEIIARAIHNRSPRRERTFVKVNCAAIPAGLLESELFGHERGAFTGALAQKIGRFEFADRGTLFLDEVGDLPLELQPKLLRVLQEQEFERVGGNRTQKVDVRVVAATNFDLAQLVAEKKFRSDLYYRLNVFPIHLPSLRERPEDVPLLVRYFVQKFSRRQNKTVEFVSSSTMDALTHYPWPGNVRELENLIERAVILSPGRELRVPLAEVKASASAGADFAAPGNAFPINPNPLPPGFPNLPGASPYSVADPFANLDLGASAPSYASAYANATNPASLLPSSRPSEIVTLEEAERQHILRALHQTGWRVAGPRGAAALLNMKRTTLQARMRKLQIHRPS